MPRTLAIGTLILLLALAVLTGSAEASRRVALVIGNQTYTHVPQLQKSDADAEVYAELFKDKGFDQVIFKTDLSRDGMDDAIADFADAVQPGDTAVFVYAGHGWSDGSQNYLVPTDAPAEGSQEQLKRYSIPIENGVNGVLDEIQARGAALKVAIIDACRDNPFKAADGTRSIGISRGFDRMADPPRGTFVVFSAGAGQSALDSLGDSDPDPDGVFTRTFVPLLKSDMTLLDATKAAQLKVSDLAATVNHDQQPAYYDQTLGDSACLSAQCDASIAVQTPAETSMAEVIAPPTVSPTTGPATITIPTDCDTGSLDAVSPDGRLLAISKSGVGVCLLDAETGKLARVIPGDMATSLTFSPDGQSLAIEFQGGGAPDQIQIHRVSSGELLYTVKGFTKDIAYSTDGTLLATGDSDLKTVTILSAATGQLLRTIKGVALNKLAFSPDGKCLATGDGYNGYGAAKLWDVKTGRLLRTFASHVAPITAVAFSPDGRQIAAGDFSGTAKVWDVASGKLLWSVVIDPTKYLPLVANIAFSPDGRDVIIGGTDGLAKMFYASGGDPERTFANPNFSSRPDDLTAIHFPADGKSTLIAWGNSAAVFDLNNGHQLRVIGPAD